MIEVSDIKDRESLQAWLEALPKETEAERDEARRWAVAIAHRAAMRVLPVYLPEDPHLGPEVEHKIVLGFWVLLLSDIAARCSTQSISKQAKAAHLRATESVFLEVAVRFLPNLYAAPENFAFFVTGVVNVIDYAAGVERAMRARTFEEVSSDVQTLEYGKSLERFTLWRFENPFGELWTDAQPKLLAQGEGWRFWVEWYDNALHGRAQDYALLTKIALIDPEDWDKGADHVNALIQKIVEQHTLAQDAHALKEEIAQLKQRLQSVEHRSHNNPPELVDETIARQKEVTIIWAALDEAEQELEKPDPDPTALARIGAFLKAASIALAQYCGSLVDLATKTSVRTAMATGTAMALASQSEQLRAFGEALVQFAKSLGAP